MGSAAVSKTAGWGFDALRLCTGPENFGRMPERLNGAVSKTDGRAIDTRVQISVLPPVFLRGSSVRKRTRLARSLASGREPEGRQFESCRRDHVDSFI